MSLREATLSLFRRTPPPAPDADPRQSSSHIEGGRRAGESENPYLTARRTWNDHLASVVATRNTWQIIGLLSLTIALACVGGMVYIGSQSKFVPYIIEVDKLGQTTTHGELVANARVPSRAIHAALSDWINCARLVTPDVSMQRRCIFKTYSMISPNDPARPKIDEWLNGTGASNPFERAKNEMVSTEIRTVLPQTPETWQVEWIETTRDRQGMMQRSPITWRAIITVYIADASNSTDEQLRNNPLSIYIKDFSWSVVR